MGIREAARTPSPTELTEDRVREIGACSVSYTYFIDNYCHIYDSVEKDWVPFRLWPSQKAVLRAIHSNQLTVILKARQLGITWLSLSYALWTMLFRPIAAVTVFSRREAEAHYMLGEERLRGMYNSLPLWMLTGHETVTDSVKEWTLANRSVARAFPTSAGDGYVSTMAIVDEADLAPDLNSLMRSVKPTIDTGGKMILLSRANKSEPESEFKAIYRNAKTGENGWFPIFLPWYANPVRTREWYNNQEKDIVSRTGSKDDLYEQYPETDAQALAPKELDKRIPPVWIGKCLEEKKAITVTASLPGFTVYSAPKNGARYVIGADPAEGNPTSDDSALTVLEISSGEEVATLAGKIEPAVFSSYIAQVSAYYNFADVMVERNNHGHTVIQWLEEHARRTNLLLGHDAETHKKDKKHRKRRKAMKAGWLSSKLGKAILYTHCTEYFRQNAEKENKIIHTLQTYHQLCNIEAATLSAPRGQNDDRADSFALAVVGRLQVIDRGHGAGLVLESVKGWGL